jgi:hypothetical protein
LASLLFALFNCISKDLAIIFHIVKARKTQARKQIKDGENQQGFCTYKDVGTVKYPLLLPEG